MQKLNTVKLNYSGAGLSIDIKRGRTYQYQRMYTNISIFVFKNKKKSIFISKLLRGQYFGYLHVIRSNIEVLRLNSFIVKLSSIQHFVQA